MGFDDPLLTAHIDNSIFTLYRRESADESSHYSIPVGSLYFTVHSRHGTGGGIIGRSWGGTIIGNHRVICGNLPQDIASIDAVLPNGEHMTGQVVSGAWLVVTAISDDIHIIFRDTHGKAIKTLNIRAWKQLPTPEDIRRQVESEWEAGLDYDPDTNEPQTSPDRSRSDVIRRYNLGDPLVTLPVRDSETASLYLQGRTGRVWQVTTGVGGSYGPIKNDLFAWEASSFAGEQVIYGLLPPTATTAIAVTEEGTPVPIGVAVGAFLAVAPSSSAVVVTFRNAKGRRVLSHSIGAEGRILLPTVGQLIRALWLRIRIAIVNRWQQ